MIKGTFFALLHFLLLILWWWYVVLGMKYLLCELRVFSLLDLLLKLHPFSRDVRVLLW